MSTLILDTEFADAEATEWVSVGLVPLDAGLPSFYVERKVLPDATEFVRTVVYPLLDRGDLAMPDSMAADALRRYLNRLPPPVTIAFDASVDWPVFLGVLNHPMARESVPEIQSMAIALIIGSRYFEALQRIWVSDERRHRRHHALVDAGVQRDAYLAALGGLHAVTATRLRTK